MCKRCRLCAFVAEVTRELEGKRTREVKGGKHWVGRPYCREEGLARRACGIGTENAYPERERKREREREGERQRKEKEGLDSTRLDSGSTRLHGPRISADSEAGARVDAAHVLSARRRVRHS